MSCKPGNKPVPWTPEQDAALRDIWPTDKRINSHRDLFGEHTYGAIMARAHNLELGLRPLCVRGQSPVAWPLVERSLKQKPASSLVLATALGFNEKTIYRVLATARKDGLVRVSAWERRSKSAKATPIFALGSAPDAPKPAPLTGAEKERRCREADRSRRVIAGESVRGINPFAVAAGLAEAPSGQRGRVVRNLRDDDREAA
jgi:hypothetical protein